MGDCQSNKKVAHVNSRESRTFTGRWGPSHGLFTDFHTQLGDASCKLFNESRAHNLPLALAEPLNYKQSPELANPTRQLLHSGKYSAEAKPSENVHLGCRGTYTAHSAQVKHAPGHQRQNKRKISLGAHCPGITMQDEEFR